MARKKQDRGVEPSQAEMRRRIPKEMRCGKAGCFFEKIRKEMPFCSYHWYKLPKDMRAAIVQAEFRMMKGVYREGVRRAKAYLKARCRRLDKPI